MVRNWFFSKTKTPLDVIGVSVITALFATGHIFLGILVAAVCAILEICFNLEDDNR